MLMGGTAQQQNKSDLKNKQVSHKVKRKVRWMRKEGESSGVKKVFMPVR